MSYSGHFGGAERILVDLATGLDRPAGVICPPGPLADRAREAGLTVMRVRARRLELRAGTRDRLAAAPRLGAQAVEAGRLLRAVRAQVVVGWNMRGALVAAAARPRDARFVFQHNDLLPGPAVARVVRAMARRADVVVALSEAIARDLAVPGVRVVHPGVDLRAFAAVGDPPAGGAPTALVLGAIVPWKRPDLALEVVSLARERRPDLRLAVAGAPLDPVGERLLEHMRARAEAPDLAGAVSFLGPLADPRHALAEASLLLHCADAEPFGMVMAEALASGRPVVAAAGGGALEIVSEECGALYEPGSAVGAADALVEVLGRGGSLGAAAQERAAALFELGDARERWRAVVDGGPLRP